MVSGAAGLEQGLEEDFLVAVELGATSREQLTDAQLEYVDKIKAKLVKVRLLSCRKVAAAVTAAWHDIPVVRAELRHCTARHTATKHSTRSTVLVDGLDRDFTTWLPVALCGC
jgi:hypothetical protein